MSQYLAPQSAVKLREVGCLPQPHSVELLEDNVLLLDRAEWRLNDGPWQARDDILRLDNAAREYLGLPPRSGDIAQPWVAPAQGQSDVIELAFSIDVAHATTALKLALEHVELARICLNGEEIIPTVTGYWVDQAFATIALPALAIGQHRLTISWPFGQDAEIEACYLLGDFGVQVQGEAVQVVAPVRNLHWGMSVIKVCLSTVARFAITSKPTYLPPLILLWTMRQLRWSMCKWVRAARNDFSRTMDGRTANNPGLAGYHHRQLWLSYEYLWPASQCGFTLSLVGPCKLANHRCRLVRWLSSSGQWPAGSAAIATIE